ncbi:MAG: hypothetical protein ACR2JJ_00240 [Sphingomicrobium sp.]
MRLATMLFAAAALAACGGPNPVASEANEGAPQPEAMVANEESPAEIRNDSVFPAGSIPPSLHGRWGVSPGDCDAPASKAEGLLVVTSDQLLFHESRAEPAGKMQTSSNSISGEFAFTSEGREQTRHMTLEFRNARLIRTERDPHATHRYVRC